jgi:hypothetical protein
MPFVIAASSSLNFTGISSALGSFLNLIGSVFSLKYLSGDSQIRYGIMRFLLFLIIFAMIYEIMVTKIKWGKGRSTAIAMAMALGVVLTQSFYIFVPLLTIFVPTLVILGACFLSVRTLSKGRFEHLIGLLLLLATSILVGNINDLITMGSSMPTTPIDAFIPQYIAILQLLVFCCFVYKLYKLLAGEHTLGKAPGTLSDWWKNRKGSTADPPATAGSTTAPASSPAGSPVPGGTPDFAPQITSANTAVGSARDALNEVADGLSGLGVFNEASDRLIGHIDTTTTPGASAIADVTRIDDGLQTAVQTYLAQAQTQLSAIINAGDFLSINPAQYGQLRTIWADYSEQVNRAHKLTEARLHGITA